MYDTVDEDLFKDDCVAVRQDWDVLQQHLRKKGQNLDLVEMPNQFAAGFGNLNYHIIFNGRPAVLRRPPMNVFVQGANDVDWCSCAKLGSRQHEQVHPNQTACYTCSGPVEILLRFRQI